MDYEKYEGEVKFVICYKKKHLGLISGCDKYVGISMDCIDTTLEKGAQLLCLPGPYAPEGFKGKVTEGNNYDQIFEMVIEELEKNIVDLDYVQDRIDKLLHQTGKSGYQAPCPFKA